MLACYSSLLEGSLCLLLQLQGGTKKLMCLAIAWPRMGQEQLSRHLNVLELIFVDVQRHGDHLLFIHVPHLCLYVQ